MSYYVQEIALQCAHAQRAWREIAAAAEVTDVPRAYYHLQAYLAAAALVSLILWPSGSDQEARRGRDLRCGLEVPDDSPLRNRGMRNHFLHFEQRLEHFLAEPRGPVRDFVDLNMHADRWPTPPPGRLRHFDPTTMVVTVRGDRLELQPVHDAILALSAQTKRDWWQMVVPPERLSGEDDPTT